MEPAYAKRNHALNNLEQINDFFLQLDKLKSVQRRSYINGGERLENSAEHSWHLAMACWNFARLMPGEFDENKLIKMALVHDLGEIGAGDTLLYDSARKDAHIKERQYIQSLTTHKGNAITELPEVWEEQETGISKETRLLKVLDRLLPVLLNLNSQGRAWRDNNVKRHQVEQVHRFIADEFPVIHQWLMAELDRAVANGWLPVE
jgi:putative hydrolases of HD superfamily